MTLRKDGRRVSLEGVLTGAALGILLLYLLEDAAAAATRPRGGGPISDPGPLDLGESGVRVGSIRVAPLEEVEVGVASGRPKGVGGGDEGPGHYGGGGGAIPFAQPDALRSAASGDTGPRRLSLPPEAAMGGGGGASPVQPAAAPAAPSRPAVVPDSPKPPGPPEPPEPFRRELPQLILVVVRTEGAASSRTLEGTATSEASLRQIGIQDSTINSLLSPGQGLELRSERLLPMSSVSGLDDAHLDLIAEHVGLLRTNFLQGAGADVLIFGSRDLLELAALAATEATASVRSRTIGMESSSVATNAGDDLVALESITKLTFTGVGTATQARLSFDLLTQAMQDSGIVLGDGNDTVTINSGFYEGAGDLFAAAAADGGLSFLFGGVDPLAGRLESLQFSLNATAVGMNNSLIDTGAGSDAISVLTRIDETIAADLAGLSVADPDVSVGLNRIGMVNSIIRMGEGDDVLRVNGSVINSLIDMGSGTNHLLLEGPLLGSSRVEIGDGGSTVTFQEGLGGLVHGGPGNDLFSLGNLSMAGEVDGGGGSDTLESSGSILGSRDLLVVNKPDQGNLAGVRFRQIETIALGRGNDVVVMDLNGTLTGQLLGGSGLDRLEFTEWTLPVEVDLDRGVASTVYGGKVGGISGFEQVIGGLAADRLSTSGAYAGIDGADGDDLLFLRWSPWLSPPQNGVELRGGAGRDLFLIGGLESAIPTAWDGTSGLPKLLDLDLSGTGTSGGIGITDRLGWLQQETRADGTVSQNLQLLSPSGLEGLGDARLLPIAPLEQLLSGMTDNTRQLAIATDPLPGGTMVLHLLGSDGVGTSQPVALVHSQLLGQPSEPKF